MIEHTPWVGSAYEQGLDGQKIAIVGYSHWLSDGEPDSPNVTIDVISRVVSGEYDDIAFFRLVREYFGNDDASEFWKKVMFMNFVPEAIGTGDDRYESASGPDQIRGQQRFLKLMKEHSPDKILVFTTKGWTQLPRLREESPPGKAKPLGAEFPAMSWGTYEGDLRPMMAFGLRHSQFARGEMMRRAVRFIMDMAPVEI